MWPARFSTWLTRILINCALASLRTRTRRAEVALDAVDQRAVAGTGNVSVPGDGEQMAALQQVGRLIEDTIDALPAKYRVVFIMREVEEMTGAEAASCLGISQVNAKVRLHRAKRLLRQALLRTCRIFPFMDSSVRAVTP